MADEIQVRHSQITPTDLARKYLTLSAQLKEKRQEMYSFKKVLYLLRLDTIQRHKQKQSYVHV